MGEPRPPELGANEMQVENLTRALTLLATTWIWAKEYEQAELNSMLVEVVVVTSEEVHVALPGDLPDEGAFCGAGLCPG